MPITDGIPGLQEPYVPPVINLHLILDVSPSMKKRWPQTISGLNEYFDSIRKDQADNDQPYKVTLTTFSQDVKVPYDRVELDSIPTFTEKNLSPHGWGTALYDAVGTTIESINTTEPVLVVILTDGEENQSQTWDSDRVAKLMDGRQKLGNYTYAYLGISKEAWGNATKMGNALKHSVSNIAAEKYTGATLSTCDGGLANRTISYSSVMRSARKNGTLLNVSKFFEDTPCSVDATDVDSKV